MNKTDERMIPGEKRDPCEEAQNEASLVLRTDWPPPGCYSWQVGADHVEQKGQW